MAALAPAFSPGSYTWTFPGCPIQIRLRLDVVDALQHLVERAQDPDTTVPVSGLLLGDTATSAVTQIAAMEPLATLDSETVEAAISQAECEVVGFFRAVHGSLLQPGASLRMTEDDVALTSVRILPPIELRGTADRKHRRGSIEGGLLLLGRREDAGRFLSYGLPARFPSTRRAGAAEGCAARHPANRSGAQS